MFSYSIIFSFNIKLKINYSISGIKILLPESLNKKFLSKHHESFKENIDVNRKEFLQIIIEKDFFVW